MVHLLLFISHSIQILWLFLFFIQNSLSIQPLFRLVYSSSGKVTWGGFNIYWCLKEYCFSYSISQMKKRILEMLRRTGTTCGERNWANVSGLWILIGFELLFFSLHQNILWPTEYVFIFSGFWFIFLASALLPFWMLSK